MKFYLAPLEGITGYVYRNALEKYFPGADRYFTPFIVPDQNHPLRRKEHRDILPANNQVGTLIPQILTSSPDRFREAAAALQEYGYEEVNLNLGCPSGTVVSGKRGAGFLAYPEELDRFLDRIFSENQVRISIKTRIGMAQPEEAFRLMEIYAQYPVSELIIHPRTRQEFYRGEPHRELFAQLLPLCTAPVCYNGNLLTVRDYEAFCGRFGQEKAAAQECGQVNAVMLGRGVIANPGLLRELADMERAAGGPGDDGRYSGRFPEQKPGGRQCSEPHKVQYVREAGDHRIRKTTKPELRAFHDEVLNGYREAFGDDNNAVFRMKEMWTYLLHSFEGAEKCGKRIRKSRSLAEYVCEVDRLFAECRLCTDGPSEWKLPQK